METGFFKWVWRFNAIVIAVAALFFLLAALIGVWQFWKDMTRDRYATNVINVDQQDTSLKEELSYADPIFSNDGSSIALALTVSQDYEISRGIGSYGSGKSTGRNTINYLIIDRNSGNSRWVFPDHSQLIVATHHIKRPFDGDEENKEVVARLYEIVTEDTNDDKRLSGRDRKTLIITPPDRSKLTELLAGFDRLVSFNHSDNSSFEVIVETDDRFTLYKFSLHSQQQIGKIELPAAPTSR